MGTLAHPVEQFQVGYHHAMAAVLSGGEKIRQEAGFVGVQLILWNVASTLKNIVRLGRDLQESMVRFSQEQGPVPEELIQKTVRSGSELLASIDRFMEVANRAKLNNRRVTAPSLMTITKHREAIEDYVDTLRLSIDPTTVRTIAEAHADFLEGRGVSLDSLMHE